MADSPSDKFNFNENYASKNQESKRPRDIKFLQQRLPTYYPVFNAGCVFPLFFIISIIFIPLGIGIYFYADNIQELSILYSECKSLNPEHANETCEAILDGVLHKKYHRYNVTSECHCRMDFELQGPINDSVYIYYALTNFYQNHLRYYTNRDENQFKGGSIREKDNGEVVAVEPSEYCKPEHYRFDNLKRPILPCGLQANSMFFDVIQLSHWYDEQDHIVPLQNTGIAWESDKKKFKNPGDMDNPNETIRGYFGKPLDWKKTIWELDTNNVSNNGFDNEDFIIWMKTAAFPNFRKLHRIVEPKNSYKDGLPAGKYSLLIEYHMAVSKFEGTKSVMLTNSRMIAGRNYFLAGAYVITGIILLVLFVVFCVLHLFTTKNSYSF